MVNLENAGDWIRLGNLSGDQIDVASCELRQMFGQPASLVWRLRQGLADWFEGRGCSDLSRRFVEAS